MATRAATVIQSSYRGHVERRNLLCMLDGECQELELFLSGDVEFTAAASIQVGERSSFFVLSFSFFVFRSSFFVFRFSFPTVQRHTGYIGRISQGGVHVSTHHGQRVSRTQAVWRGHAGRLGFLEQVQVTPSR
jgi:hypothetical protein